MDKWQALNNFFNSFGVTAYEESTVPDNATFPRITYESRTGALDDVIQIDCSVWDLSNSWGTVDRVVNTIESVVNSYACPQIEGGRYRVFKGTPFAQRMKDPENDNIRRTVIHLNFEFMTI